MILLLLFVFGTWISLIQCFHLEKDWEIEHVEPVLNFRIFGKNEDSRTLPSGHHQPHADEVQISFSAFGKEWNLELYVDYGIISPNTVFNFYGDEHIIVKPHHTIYKTKTGKLPVATVNIHDDDTIHAMIGTEEDHFTIDPASLFPEFQLPTKMGMYRFDHVNGMKVNLPSYSNTSRSLLQVTISENDKKPPYTVTDQSKDTGVPTQWPNCYPNQGSIKKRLAMGLAITNEYYTTKGKGGQATMIQEIKNMFADSNSIFTPQMGVYLGIEIVDVRTTAGTGPVGGIDAPWNLPNTQRRNSGCGQTASTALDQFRTWRATNHPKDAGLWHLMTTCFPPAGTVGIAYLNAICSGRIGSGITSSGTTLTWTVFAHEVGHNFGGQHSFELGQGRTGGIMDYGPGTLGGIYQFNTQFRKTEICQRISISLNAQNQNAAAVGTCWSNFVPGTSTDTYEWLDSTEVICSVTCGKGQQTTIKKCYKTAPGQTPILATDVSLCPLTKPPNKVEECTKAACTGTDTCGDGIVQSGLPRNEECDLNPPNEACCSANCKNVPSAPATCASSVQRDTCFASIKVAKVYCFKGDLYNRYALGSSTPEAGYPRKTALYWKDLGKGIGGGTIDWTKDYDAIIQRPEGRLYFIKGSKFAVYELGFGAHNPLPAEQDIVTFFGLPATWADKVVASVSMRQGQGYAFIFTMTQYCLFAFDGSALDNGGATTCAASTYYPRPITDWSGGRRFPLDAITAGIGYFPELTQVASNSNLDSSVDLMHGNKYYRYKFGVGLAEQPVTLSAFGTIVTQGNQGGSTSTPQACAVGCIDCPIPTQCAKCDQDFKLVNDQCQPEQYVVEMLFDDLSMTGDRSYVSATSVENNRWSNGVGNVKQAATLNVNDFIDINPFKIPKNMKDFEYHFWVNIDAASNLNQFALISGQLDHGMNEYDFVFYLKYEQQAMKPSYKLAKRNDPSDMLFVTSGVSIPKNRWVHLIATLNFGQMTITIEGQTISVPIDGQITESASTGVMVEKPWIIRKFTIGRSSIASNLVPGIQGIEGRIDQFHIDKLSETTSTSNSLKGYSCYNLSWFFIAYIAVLFY